MRAAIRLFWIYLDINVLLGRCLEELDAQLVRQLLASFGGDHPLVLHVALVADQDHLGVVARVGFDLRDPVLHRIERLLVRDVVHQDEAHRASVVGRRYRPVSLLACRVLQRGHFNQTSTTVAKSLLLSF